MPSSSFKPSNKYKCYGSLEYTALKYEIKKSGCRLKSYHLTSMRILKLYADVIQVLRTKLA